jgi:hypothetical protein
MNIFNMKTSIAFLLVMMLMAFHKPFELPIGSDMPGSDVKMKDAVTGKQVSLKEAQQKNGLLVMFSCNTCPVVVANQQRTNEIAAFALKNDIGVILVNSNEAQRSGDDSFEAMKAYADQHGYKWHYTVDKNNVLADAFGAKRTPETFLFNKESKLVYHGAIDDNPNNSTGIKRNHLKEAVQELMAGKEISVKTSRSIGCSIKRI